MLSVISNIPPLTKTRTRKNPGRVMESLKRKDERNTAAPIW